MVRVHDMLAHRFRAEAAMNELMASVVGVLGEAGAEGLTNAEIGRLLNIYMGHKRHSGHISRTLLAMLEQNGFVTQDADKRWHLTQLSTEELQAKSKV